MKKTRRTNTVQMFRSILCPVDFSVHSEVALRYATALAKRSRGRLHVMYVNDPRLLSTAAIVFGDKGLATETLKELRQFVGKAIPEDALAEGSIRYLAEAGDPAPTIARTATRLGCDLIVTGTHGLGGVSKVLMGSTSERLLRRSPVPVLTVPPCLAEAVGRQTPASSWPGPVIMVPLDLRDESVKDVQGAATMARALGAQLLLVHVVAEPQPPPWYKADMSAQSRLRVAKARLHLDTLVKAVEPVVATEARVLVGSPADEIAAAAADERVGLVLMHLRRGPGLLGARAGSLTYHVLQHAVTAVLAVPPQSRRASSTA